MINKQYIFQQKVIIHGNRTSCHVGLDTSVGTATRYGLYGPGIESRWGGEILHTRPDLPWGPPSLLCNRYQVFPGGTAAEVWR